jgi:membrane-associated phosphatidylinositol transfer protein
MHTCHCVPHGKGLRKLILRAHRQAWCWQDEYQNMTLADIRRLEDEAQEELNTRIAKLSHQAIRVEEKNQ